MTVLAIDWSSPFHVEWQSLYDSAVTAVALYGFIIAATRFAGIRSLGQVNNFDWIVTIAMGAIMAGAIGTESITMWDGIVSIGTLMTVQHILTSITRRSEVAERIVKAEASVLVEDGEFLQSNLDRNRLTEGDVMSAVREAGYTDLKEVRYVHLEPSARLSVVGGNDRDRVRDRVGGPG